MPLPGAFGRRLDAAAGLAMRALIRAYQLGMAPIVAAFLPFLPELFALRRRSHFVARAVARLGSRPAPPRALPSVGRRRLRPGPPTAAPIGRSAR